MRKKFAVVGTAALAVVIGAYLVAGCAIDDQIGVDEKGPIRQLEVFKPGDPFGYIGETPIMFTKVSLYLRYVDINNNGSFDKNVDEVVWRTPRSDPPYYYDGREAKD